jgi:hypothetical protein
MMMLRFSPVDRDGGGKRTTLTVCSLAEESCPYPSWHPGLTD